MSINKDMYHHIATMGYIVHRGMPHQSRGNEYVIYPSVRASMPES